MHISVYARLSWVKSIVSSADKLCVADCSRAWGKKSTTHPKSRVWDFPAEPISRNGNCSSSPRWYRCQARVPLPSPPLTPARGGWRCSGEGEEEGFVSSGCKCRVKSGQAKERLGRAGPAARAGEGWAGRGCRACCTLGEMSPCARGCALRAGGELRGPPPCGPPPPPCAAAPAAPPGRNPQRPPSSADRNRGWKRDRPSPRGGGWARGSPRALPGPLAAPAPGQGPPPPPPRQAGEGAQPHLPASPLRRGHGGAAVPSPPRCVGWWAPPSSEQPRVGRSFSGPASAEVFAAIGTGAAEPVAWQRERVLFPVTNIVSIVPDHLPFRPSARAGEPSEGKCSSPKWADQAPFHHSGDAGSLALNGCPTGEFIQHRKQSAVVLGSSDRISTKRTSPLKETRAN